MRPRALDAALPINSHHGSLYFHLSRVLQRRQRPEEALVAVRPAVALAPTDAPPARALAKLLMEAGRLQEAEVVLRQAFELHPDDPWLHSHLSLLLQRRQQPAPVTGKSKTMKAVPAAAG